MTEKKSGQTEKESLKTITTFHKEWMHFYSGQNKSTLTVCFFLWTELSPLPILYLSVVEHTKYTHQTIYYNIYPEFQFKEKCQLWFFFTSSDLCLPSFESYIREEP